MKINLLIKSRFLSILSRISFSASTHCFPRFPPLSQSPSWVCVSRIRADARGAPTPYTDEGCSQIRSSVAPATEADGYRHVGRSDGFDEYRRTSQPTICHAILVHTKRTKSITHRFTKSHSSTHLSLVQ